MPMVIRAKNIQRRLGTQQAALYLKSCGLSLKSALRILT